MGCLDGERDVIEGNLGDWALLNDTVLRGRSGMFDIGHLTM